MPELILATIKSGFDFGVELLKWLQTPDGKAFAQKVATDTAARDKALAEFSDWTRKFFAGELWK